MKKVFLDDFNKYINGRFKGKIDWNNNIGNKIRFMYYDIVGVLEITDYEKETHCVWVKYLDNEPYKTRTSNLIYGQLGELLEIYSTKFKYNEGQQFKDDKRDITITKTYNKDNANVKKWYKYTCNKCGWDEGEMNESNLTTGNGCPVCSNPSKKTVKGINDIATTHPHLTKYFANTEDTYIYSFGSDKFITTKCLDCGFERQTKISELSKYNFSCKKCGDGVSYPEKIFFNVLEQLNIEFTTQLNKTTFEWCKNYKYDFYIKQLNIIFEINGRHHYEKSFSTCGGRTLKEEFENDRLKKELALSNGINEENYIVIDCRKSELEFIKDNILNSSLAKLFDLTKIDWVKAEAFALSSLVKEACTLWNNGVRSTREIGAIMKLAYPTIIRYLKIGSKINWCDYDPKETQRNAVARSVICISTNEKFNSISEAGLKYNLHTSNINIACNNIYKSAGKHRITGESLKWMYYEDYLKASETEIENILTIDVKKIICLTTGDVFNDTKGACKYCETTKSSSITACCKGKLKTAYKHPLTGERLKWMYYEDYLKLHSENKAI